MTATTAADSTPHDATLLDWRGIAARMRSYEAWVILGMPAVFVAFVTAVSVVPALLRSTLTSYGTFGSFWASGWAASHSLNPYGVYPLVWHAPAFPGGPMVFDVNLNPPLLLPLFQLFAKYTPRIGFGVWTLISLLSFISGAAVLLFTVEPLLQKRKIVFLLLCVSTIQTLYFGQIYAVPFFICCCIALCLIGEKRPMGTYILVGVIIAIKPNFALWAIMLFVAGYRMAAVISTSTALGLTIVPALIYKPSVYLQWLTAYSQIPHYLFPTDVSIAGIITRLGSRQLGLALSAVVGIVLVLLVRRLRPSEMDVSGIALCAGILCSPLAWFHYSLFVAPFLVVARRWGPTETFAACLMFFPDLQDYVMHRTAHSPVDLTVATLPYFIGLSLMLFSFVKRQSFWSADKEIPASSH